MKERKKERIGTHEHDEALSLGDGVPLALALL